MFIDNKYTKIYYKIIEKAINSNRIKMNPKEENYMYFENHHIIPSSIGGTDDDSNMVLLTAREHFICHYLLCKMIAENTDRWQKLVRAFTFMYSSGANHNRYTNSRLYESARKNIGKIMSDSQTGRGNSQYGTTWITNYDTKEILKIPKSDLPLYLEKGFKNERVVSWEIHEEKIRKKKERIELKVKSKIDKINEKISIMENQKKILLIELERLRRP